MRKFNFTGSIPSSKSILNRLLVIQSFRSDLQVRGDSICDDVLKMREGLVSLLRNETIDCGAAGTTFRFLALRASREPGTHFLRGTPELLKRPQTNLIDTMRALGIEAQQTEEGLRIKSDGWKKPFAPLKIDRSQSSQFASAVLLNTWNLDFDLEIDLGPNEQAVSEGYFAMTEEIVLGAGMPLQKTTTSIRIPKASAVRAREITAEPDLSSAFAVAALAVASGGEARFENFPVQSLQPDSVYPLILQAMGASVNRGSIRAIAALKSIEWNIRDCPDLFPVLSVLCAMADGRSVLFGAPHLAYKESSRIESTATLLRALGCRFELRGDGIEIFGGVQFSQTSFDFDPKHDHRLAMAAAVAIAAGARIRILHPEVVGKSFPEFWSVFESGFLPACERNAASETV